MYYSAIKNCDIANGPGCRVSLFVSGCRNRCKGCFQPETWDFEYGERFAVETEERLMEMLGPWYIDGLTVLGGEPMEPENQRALVPFLRRGREEYPGKSIWCYTGYTWEELTAAEGGHPRCEVTGDMLSLLDVLVDGRYVEAERDISLRFRGSRNQRIIAVRNSLAAGRVVLWPGIRRERHAYTTTRTEHRYDNGKRVLP